MAKNPLLEKKFQEGYNKGFMAGKDAGIAVSVDFIVDRFRGLSEVPGIGEKTFEKIRNHFGPDYFKEIDR